MKFVITGHLGLIGFALKKRLEDDGNKCVFKMDLRDGYDVCCDLSAENRHSADVMLHLAANCKINKCIENPGWAFENVIGIHEVLEFCRINNIPKVIAFSSSRILSDEINPYTASKIYLEELCRAYENCYGIKSIIIRPSTVYGPFNDRTHRLVDIWVRDALNGYDLKIYGDPKTKTLDFTYIDDFVDGVILALEYGKEKEYNISGEEEFNLKELAGFIIKETGSKSKIVIKDKEIEQPQGVSLDISKIKELGYSPKVKLKEGIRKTIKFYKKHKLQ